MIFSGVDLSGWLGGTTSVAIIESTPNTPLQIKALFQESSLHPQWKTLSNDYKDKLLIEAILDHSPKMIAFDAPFSVPAPLCNMQEPYYEIQSTGRELHNPYIYDNSARFLYELTGLKVMPPAADRIGRITARMIALQHRFSHVIHFQKSPPLTHEYCGAFECYPKAILKALIPEVPPYKKERWDEAKADLISAISPFFKNKMLNEQLHNDDLFDALLAALGAYSIAIHGVCLPKDDASQWNSFIALPTSVSL